MSDELLQKLVLRLEQVTKISQNPIEVPLTSFERLTHLEESTKTLASYFGKPLDSLHIIFPRLTFNVNSAVKFDGCKVRYFSRINERGQNRKGCVYGLEKGMGIAKFLFSGRR